MIASALLCGVLSFSCACIDSLFDIAGLLAHFTNNPAGVGVKNAIVIDVSDVADGGAHVLLKVKLRIAGYLAADDDEVAFGERFASHATQRILLKTGVENVIADGVANFVGMTFGDGFGRKNVTTRHGFGEVIGYKSYNVKSGRGMCDQDGCCNNVTLLTILTRRASDILTNHDASIYRWLASWRQPLICCGCWQTRPGCVCCCLLDQEELSVADLQQILGMGQSRISSHLAQLKRAGVVADRRVGKNVYYGANHQGRNSQRERVAEITRLLARELPETSRDRTSLKLVLHKRQDKARKYFDELAGKFGRSYVPGRSWKALAHTLITLAPAADRG